MKIGFFVTDLKLERAQYSTYWVAMSAVARGHFVYHISAADIEYTASGALNLKAKKVPGKKYRNSNHYFETLTEAGNHPEIIDITDLDVLLLRSDPAIEAEGFKWVQPMALQLGRIARARGVVVLNDPDGLSKAMDKLYLQLFPDMVRPLSIITRRHQDIKHFAAEQPSHIIIKPVQGSGGKGVFIIQKGSFNNFRQMVDSLLQDGYVIAQEYIPEAVLGDTRLFMMNGEPLQKHGKFAAFRRLRQGDDVRSNVHVGAKIARAEITDKMLELASAVRPRLVEDGMFLVGLDIVGGKILEINVFCPGGLRNAQRLEGVDFASEIVAALERKDRYLSYYSDKWYNLNPSVL